VQSSAKQIIELSHVLEGLNSEELLELQREVLTNLHDPVWTPLPGPQMDALENPADIVFFGGSAGGSKALALDTPIPTQGGWTTIGEIQERDLVFSELGKLIRVLQIHPINPSPVSYRLKFDDGTEIDASSDHRWLTFDARELAQLTRLDPEWRVARRRRRKSRRKITTSDAKYRRLCALNEKLRPMTISPPCGTVRTAEEIHNTITVRNGTRKNHAIRVCNALELPNMELPIDPYLLGLWLGDGTSAQAAITTSDQDIVDYINTTEYECKKRKNEKYSYGINGGFKVKLREHGLLGHKHIPSAYLRASKVQRLALLYGLMDADGTANKSGSVSFTTTREELAEGTHDLIVSMGWKAKVTERRAKLYGKDCGPVWNIKWTPSEYVFRLERKKRRQKLSVRRTTKFRYIVSCEPIFSVPMRCLTVDNPTGIYLASRSMVPTHNSDLLLGLALTQHKRSIVFRREATQTVGLVDRLAEILGTRDGLNSQQLIWRLHDRQIEFGSCKDPGDETRWQGRAHDGCFFDEICNFLEHQFRFLCTWLRTTIQGQRCRIVCTGNPPVNEDGRWVISYWGPWLDPKHPHPAEPGELRWYTTIDGKDVEVPNGNAIRVKGVMVKPMSRTFIPSKVQDNPFLMGTNYEAVLQALPEPLRSQMLEGNFQAGIRDSEWQVIPTAWVDEAQARWKEDGKKGAMDSVGVDPARGGSDRFVISTRYGVWYSPLICYPGIKTPDGATGAGLVITALKDGAPIHVDVIGIGCFDDETDILTELGWRRFDDLEKGIKVLTMNPKNCKAFYAEPTEYFTYEYDGEMLYFNGQNTNFCITPNHNLFYRCYNNRRTSKWRMTPANEVGIDYLRMKRTFLWDGVEEKCFVLPKTTRIFPGLKKGTNKAVTGNHVRVEHNVPEIKIEMDIFCKFLGWVLSEGYTTRDGYTVGIVQKKKDHIGEIGEMLRSLGFHFREKIQKDTHNFLINSKQLYQYVRSLGEGATNKRIPESIGKLSPRQIEIFLDAFHKGDGWTSEGVRYFSTSSKVLADGLQELILKTGKYASITKRHFKGSTSVIENRTITRTTDGYGIVEWKRNNCDMLLRLKSVKTRKYRGKVYCVEVGPSHLLYTRRNGKCFWSGNSSVFDHLRSNKIHVIAVNSSEAAPEGKTDKLTQKLRFRNMRSFIYWRFRESLDPKTGDNVALPPDPELKADLCAALWTLTPGGILVESKEDKVGADGVKIAGLKRRLGRSPDKGEAVLYCSITTPRRTKPVDMPPPQNLAKSYAVNINMNRQYRGNKR